MVRRVKHIVAINDYAREQYRHRTRAQFHRINVPIGDVFFDVTPRTPDPLTILIVGGMNERKDPLTLLRAVALLRSRLPGVQLRIAGRIPSSEFGDQLTAFIREYNIEENVRFLGPLNQPALAEAYASSALTALSSRQETSPAVLMEAMAARRPGGGDRRGRRTRDRCPRRERIGRSRRRRRSAVRLHRAASGRSGAGRRHG